MVVSQNFFSGLVLILLTSVLLYFLGSAIAPLTGGGLLELVVRNMHFIFILFGLITIPVWAR